MIIKVDTSIPVSTLGSRYNLIRSSIAKVIENPLTVLTKSGNASNKRPKWKHDDNSNKFDTVIINSKLHKAILDWVSDNKMKMYGSLDESPWSTESPYKNFSIIDNNLNTIIPSGCIDYIKSATGNKPDPKRLFKYLIFSTNRLSSDSSVHKNDKFNFMMDVYTEMSSDICISCPSRFECSSSVHGNGSVFGTMREGSESWRIDKSAPIQNVKHTSLIHAYSWEDSVDSETVTNNINFDESKSMNMLMAIENPLELLKVIDEMYDVPYRKLKETIRNRIVPHVTPVDIQGVITTKVNDYREKNLCDNCLSCKVSACAADHINRWSNDSDKKNELRCAYFPISVDECEVIIKSYYKHIDNVRHSPLFNDRFNFITDRAKVLFYNLRFIDCIDNSFKWKIKDSKRVVYCSVVDYIEEGVDTGRFNIVLRTDGKVRDTISMNDLLKVNGIDDELRIMRESNINKEFESYSYPYLLYFAYTHFYKNKLNDDVNIQLRGEGYDCNPILLRLGRGDNHIHHRILNVYSRSSDYGTSVEYRGVIDFLVCNSKYDHDGNRTIYKFIQTIEDFMHELKNVDPEVKKIHEAYHVRYGEPERIVQAYKTKGISK